MKYKLSSLLFVIVTLILVDVSCNTRNVQVETIPLNANNAWKQLTAAIIEDSFTPPVAGRIYAYSYLAQYEAMALADTNFCSFKDALNGFAPFVPTVKLDKDLYVPELAAIAAFLKTGERLIYRGFIVKDFYTSWLDSIQSSGLEQEMIDYSLNVAQVMSDSIINYSHTDFYKETRNMPLYNIPEGWGSWEPTPPAYGTAIEPHWPKVRPFILQDIHDYETNYNFDYDTTVGSSFYKEAMVVYNSVKEITDAQQRQAEYWDCNPRETIASGHMMTFIKQMNPGGHWLAIGQTVMEDIGMPLRERMHVNAIVALTIHDAIIVCWNEKYKTNLIRPETYINRYVDPQWHPILETPLFPEFTSGHSVISTASATVLTDLVGDSIAYTDSVNFFLGLPPRSFHSFMEASHEAAMSRMLGGIHYMPAINLGIAQGAEVGDTLLQHLTHLDCDK